MNISESSLSEGSALPEEKTGAIVMKAIEKLNELSSKGKEQPIATLKETQDVLQTIRLLLGEKLSAIFNQWEGMRWESLETSQTIASLMDELASSIRTSFQKDSQVGRLRCVADGRDKKPSFRLECLDSHGRQIVRASARALPKSELVDSPPDKRRKHRKK